MTELKGKIEAPVVVEVKIIGTGPKGRDGEDGKSAYEHAVEGGYAGTEEEFNKKQAAENKFSLPEVTEEDNGKVLTVEDGEWKAKELPVYEGDYTITPKTTAQTMETAQTFMSDDVTVNAIPFYETSNTAGGNTVYIGEELE